LDPGLSKHYIFMQPDTSNATIVAPVHLANLEMTQVVDMLQSKTQLLITASLLHVKDQEYMTNLREEVKRLQDEIQSRQRSQPQVH
jgi:formiminotetrahydrofolate cyclodeaminase